MKDDRGEPIFFGRMTKKVLFALPEGVYLMSNVTDEIGAPEVAQTIPLWGRRDCFWRHLRGLKQNGRHFRVFRSFEDFQLFLAHTPMIDGPPGSPFPREQPRVH